MTITGYHEEGKLARESSEEIYASDSDLVILEEDYEDDEEVEQVTSLWNISLDIFIQSLKNNKFQIPNDIRLFYTGLLLFFSILFVSLLPSRKNKKHPILS